MKKTVMVVACLFFLSAVLPGLSMLVSTDLTSDALASETKRVQNEAYKKGQARSSGYQQGKGGSPKDDGYKDMDPDTRDAYKAGYKKGQKK